MKRILLFLLLSLSITSAFGQKIHFCDSTNVWHGYLWDDADIPYYSYPFTEMITGDTILNSTHYKILFTAHSDYVFVREDTVNKKVYALDPDLPVPYDTIEQLLYNFNLNLGDTFKTNGYIHYVSLLDSVIINSIWHKTWLLSPVTGVYASAYYVIEGIGSNASTCYPLLPYFFESSTTLTCFNNEGTTPPLSHKVGPYFDNSTSCSIVLVPLNANNVFNIKKATTLSPNPINETSKITLPYNISSGTLTIINDIGQTIINTTFQNKEELLIGDKINVPGLYFYRVTDNQNSTAFSGKFIYR